MSNRKQTLNHKGEARKSEKYQNLGAIILCRFLHSIRQNEIRLETWILNATNLVNKFGCLVAHLTVLDLKRAVTVKQEKSSKEEDVRKKPSNFLNNLEQKIFP